MKYQWNTSSKLFRYLWLARQGMKIVRNTIRYRDPHFFTSIFIETATYCNRSCPFCYGKGQNKEHKYMDRMTFNLLIYQLWRIKYTGTIAWHLFNEPLLDERLPEWIAYAHKELPKCLNRVYTNGDFLTVEMMKKLVDAGVYEVLVADHNKTREEYLRRLEPVLKQYSNYIRLLPNDSVRLLGDLMCEIPEEQSENLVAPVWSELSVCTVSFTGEILLCCRDYERHKFGSIVTERIEEIWKKRKFRNIKKRLRKGIYDIDICKRCRLGSRKFVTKLTYGDSNEDIF